MSVAVGHVAAHGHSRRPPPDLAPDHLEERPTSMRILVTPLFALAFVIFAIVAADDLVGLMPGAASYGQDASPRLAHGSIALLRVVDQTVPPVDGVEPLFAVEGDHAYIDAGAGAIAVDLASGAVEVPASVAVGVRDTDARGRRYLAEATTDGATIRRVAAGRTIAIATAPFAYAAAWTWTVSADGTVYAVAWTDDGDIVRARVYRLLAPDPLD